MPLRRILLILAVLLWAALPAAAETGPRLVLQDGHEDAIVALALSPDGRLALTGGKDSTARVWDLERGRVRATLPGHRRADGYQSSANAAVFSPDGRTAVTAGGDGRAVLWNLATAEIERVLLEPPAGDEGWEALTAAAFRPDGKLLALGSRDGSVYLVDPAAAGPVGRLEGTEDVTALAFSPDGRLLAVGNDRRGAEVWDVAARRRVAKIEGHASPVHGVAFSRDGRLLATCGDYGKVYLWKSGSWELAADLSLEDSVRMNSVAFSPDGKIVAAGAADERAYLWEVGSGRPLPFPRGRYGGYNLVAFRPDGGALVSTGDDARIHLWELPSGKELATLQGRSSQEYCMAVSPDGGTLAVGAQDCSVHLWDLSTGRLRRALETPASAMDLDLTREGRRIAVGGLDGHLRIYDGGGKLLHDLEAGRLGGPMGSNAVEAVAFRPDGTLVACGGPRGVHVFEAATGRLRATLEHKGGVSGLSWGRDGMTLATSSYDGEVRLWNVQEKRPVESHKVPQFRPTRRRATAVAWSPDGTRLAAGTHEGMVVLFDVGHEEEGKVMEAWEKGRPGRPVASLAWSPDGRQLAVGADDRVLLFEPSKGLEARWIGAHDETVSAVAFTMDGRRLFTASADTTTGLWDAATGQRLATALALDNGREWVVTDPEGLFDGSAGGQRLIEWRIGDRLYALEQFFADHYSPGLLGRLVASGASNLAKPEPVMAVVRENPPPRLEILSPAPGAVLEGSRVTVSVRVVDQGGGISQPRLYLNGHRLPASTTAGLRGDTVDFQVDLVDGVNRLRAVAFNSSGKVESRPEEIAVACAAAEARKPELHLLAVGVDRYQNGMNLEFARGDAEAIPGLFRPGLFGKVNATTLVDDQATREGILEALAATARRAAPQDAFLLFLAGHGTLVGDIFYFLPHDARVENDEALRRTGISAVELADAMAAIPALKQVVVMDACHSGASANVVARFRSSPEMPKAQQWLARSAGTFLIAASSAEQKAAEVRELKHGVLTYCILQALGKGGPAGAPLNSEGLVTVNSLLRYVSEEVPRITEQHLKTTQQVTQYSNGQDFPLAVPFSEK